MAHFANRILSESGLDAFVVLDGFFQAIVESHLATRRDHGETPTLLEIIELTLEQQSNAALEQLEDIDVESADPDEAKNAMAASDKGRVLGALMDLLREYRAQAE